MAQPNAHLSVEVNVINHYVLQTVLLSRLDSLNERNNCISDLEHVLKDEFSSSFFPLRVDNSFFKQKYVPLFALSSRLLLPEQNKLLKKESLERDYCVYREKVTPGGIKRESSTY